MSKHKLVKQPKSKMKQALGVGFVGLCGVTIIASLALGYSAYQDKNDTEVPTAQAQKDKPVFKDKSQLDPEDTKNFIDTIKPGEKAVSAQTPYFPVVVHRTTEKYHPAYNQLELNADTTNVDNPELLITYTDDYEKVTKQSLQSEDEIGWEYQLLPDNAKVYDALRLNLQLEGYGAYKDPEGNWQRIKSIKSRPEIESKYQDKGGRSAKEVEKANAKAEEAYTKMLNKYAEQMQGDTILDFSSAPELNSMTGGAEAKEGIKTLNRLVMEQADTIRKPFTLYTRLSWSQSLNQEGYEALKDEDYAYNYFDAEYGTLLTTEAVDKMNQGYQAAVEALTDTEGATILTHVGITPNNETININGVTYNKGDVILDVYHTNTVGDELIEVGNKDFDFLKEIYNALAKDVDKNISLRFE